MKNSTVLADDEEYRGFKVKLYPTYSQKLHLDYLENALRGVWNQVVKYREDADQAITSLAVRNGLVLPKPMRPNYDGMTPTESAQAAQKHTAAVRKWWDERRSVTADRADCPRGRGTMRHQDDDLITYMGGGKRSEKKHNYQALQFLAAQHGHNLGAALLQHLAENYRRSFAKKRPPPRFKRRADRMPIGLRSGKCFLLGDFGARRGMSGWYGCIVKIEGMRIRGRLPGKKPEGHVIEGVSIVREGGHWFASVRVVCKKRVLKPAIPGTVIGIDVGLDNIAAMVDATDAPMVFGERGVLITNPRGEPSQKRKSKNRQRSWVHQCHLAREDARMTRRIRHILYNEVIKPLANVETIVVEELPSGIGTKAGSSKVSVMRLVTQMLKARYGTRVREVGPEYTSQTCSKCHKRSDGWNYFKGSWGKCTHCHHHENRDINAARNIADKFVV